MKRISEDCTKQWTAMKEDEKKAIDAKHLGSAGCVHEDQAEAPIARGISIPQTAADPRNTGLTFRPAGLFLCDVFVT
jgi:hypothetical protein